MLPANSELLMVAERAALAGAQALLTAFGGAQAARQKSHRRDLVTAADTDSERAILAILATASDAIGLLSEEAGLTRPGAQALWVVDPLDGTANFARGYPVFSISIACVAPDGPLCGLIFDPLRDELYTATRGGGARLGNRPLRVSEAGELGGAFISTGFPYYPSEDRRRMADVVAALATEAQDVRRGGSAALDLAYVAAGRSEAHIELNLAPHDVAAGVLLVTEAGGRVQALRADANGWPRGLVASNGSPLHNAVRDPVATAFALQAAPLSFASLFG
jgi:myo-inositol-1(or 4)-monophosphatase